MKSREVGFVWSARFDKGLGDLVNVGILKNKIHSSRSRLGLVVGNIMTMSNPNYSN